MPLFVQNQMISAFGFYWRNRRYGGSFARELDSFILREFYTKKQWEEYQTMQLRELLVHAYENIPFYFEKYSQAGISQRDLGNIELIELGKIPCLTKDELRQFGTTLLLNKKAGTKGSFFSTSGSTGTPAKIFFSKLFHQKWNAAIEARVRRWAGLDRFNSRAMIGGRRIIPDGNAKPPFYRYNKFERQTYFSAYHISARTIENYAEGFWTYKPDYLTGYAMSIFFLARFLVEAKIKVPELKAVITSSEKLTSEMRQVIQLVFGCKTYDSYSGVEACGLISENEYGQLLISPDVGIMEVLNDSGLACRPGETGEIYSTGFLNYEQPLIRYRIGDVVTLAVDQKTKCGRSMPVVQEISGRVEDTVVGSDGREMVRFHGVFLDLPSVIEGQIIQEEIGKIEVKVVCSNVLSPDERDRIKKRLLSQLGTTEITINQVDYISRNANGKFQSVISKVKRPLLTK